MDKLLDIEAFRGALRRGDKTAVKDAAVFAVSAGKPKATDEARRAIRFCFSDAGEDRMTDKIDADGWQLENFLKNPVALFAHDSYAPPIGRATNLAIEQSRLMGDVEFAPAEIYDFADTIYKLVKGGYLNAVSVGFMPIDYDFADEDGRDWGIDFKSQELLEISVVPIPANPRALIDARAKGLDTRPLVEWAEKTLDGGGKIVLPRAELERLRKMAKEPPRHVQRATEDWRCGAAKDLPIDDSNEWDGSAAEESIFSWAGFDGDSPDADRAKKGFLVYDASKPKEKGSYKLPFCRVVNGELKAVDEGVRAAASRLPQTDIPDSEQAVARDVIDHYEKRMGIDDGEKGVGALAAKIARILRESGMAEGDPAAGGALVPNCGRSAGEECGLKDPAECAVHGENPMDEKTIAAIVRREVAAALKGIVKRESGDGNGEMPSVDGDGAHKLEMAYMHTKSAGDLLDAASEHHEKALGYLDEVRQSVRVEPPEEPASGDPDNEEAKAVAQRRAEARRLRQLYQE